MQPADHLFRSRRHFLRSASAGALVLGGGLSLITPARAAELLQGRKKLGVALCGLGSYARGQLAPALRETKLCELRGVVTGDPEKGRRWAGEYGFPESSVYGYDTIQQMADNDDIDILYSVTPPALHKRDTLRAFEAGKHVISEKPMAPTVADCDEMIAAAEKAGKQLSVGYRLHFHPYYKKVERLAESGKFGPFMDLKGGFGSSSPQVGTWRMQREMGGGPLRDVGIYPIYCASIAKNGARPVAVRATMPPKTRPEVFESIEETVYFVLEYADGSTLEGETSWVESSNHYRAEGADGWFAAQPAYSYDGLRARTSEGDLPSRDGFNQQAHQVDAFAAAILEGRPSSVPGTMGRRDIATIEAIFKAAESGERVEVRSEWPTDVSA